MSSAGLGIESRHWSHAAAIVGAVLLVYSNCLDAGFRYDDFANILRNPGIRWSTLDLDQLGGLIPEMHAGRPVAYASFALNYYLGGYQVEGYRAVNVLIHCANGLLVYLLVGFALRRGRGPGRPEASGVPAAALVAALLFVVHPIQTQSVTYIVQRMSSLAAFFYLTALLLYLRGRLAGGAARPAWWGASLAAWLLAMGSKEIAFTFFAAAWLCDWYFLRDLDWRWARRTLPLLIGLYAVLGLLAYFAYGGSEAFRYYPAQETPALQRALTQLRVVARYLGLIALPLPGRLNLLHHVETSRSLLSPPTTALALLLLLGLLSLAALWARGHRLVSFAILWFLLHLAIESSVLPVAPLYEHRTYLPMVGVALLAGHLFAGVAGRRRLLAPAVAAVLILALGTAAYARNEVWRDGVRFWSDVLAKNPHHPRAHMNLGAALAIQGRHAEGLPHLERAVDMDPGSLDAQRNLAISLMGVGRAEASLEHFAEAQRLGPGDALTKQALSGALLVLAVMRVEEGRAEQARELLTEALGLAEQVGDRPLAGVIRAQLEGAALDPEPGAAREPEARAAP